ncbi:hypothetical protein [Leptospira ilyithenensis]|uniref:Uncharacterized protein n=1 Tax=Leptospira ilyithenensis TaxID=2484901 RepID=A0A4R9LJK8_9LEPT|nr:hypothetical protein [Leptospira ilyithenensis]TGN07066.1 hypothetical protein EHS11_18265 [Leptospira ilyithenensis]
MDFVFSRRLSGQSNYQVAVISYPVVGGGSSLLQPSCNFRGDPIIFPRHGDNSKLEISVSNMNAKES